MKTTKRRMGADVAVIVVAVFTVAQAIWGPALLPEGSQDPGASALWLNAILAGGGAIAGLGLSQRWLGLGRALVALAGVVILIGAFTYRSPSGIAMTFAIVAGIVLIAAAKFIGPVPPPTTAIYPPAPEPPPLPKPPHSGPAGATRN
jgi:hypothetical protein